MCSLFCKQRVPGHWSKVTKCRCGSCDQVASCLQTPTTSIKVIDLSYAPELVNLPFEVCTKQSSSLPASPTGCEESVDVTIVVAAYTSSLHGSEEVRPHANNPHSQSDGAEGEPRHDVLHVLVSDSDLALPAHRESARGG
mmetsp:Transcript_28128/g.84086  ORF Transcript_28128/g.84086 Transcript_28128/m.84086 type:complete len:140 (+) Transcript_28128:152-571(+)